MRFFRHFYQLLLKFNRRETAAAASTVNVNMLIEDILKSTYVCREALNSSIQTIYLGSGHGKLKEELFEIENVFLLKFLVL